MPNDRAVEKEAERQRVLHEAQVMAEWFSDYRYGAQAEAGPIPALTVQRLKLIFGEGEAEQQIALVRDEFAMFDEDHHPNLALYICGYPQDTLATLEMGDMSETVRMLHERFIPPVAEIAVVPVSTVALELSKQAIKSVAPQSPRNGSGKPKNVRSKGLTPDEWASAIREEPDNNRDDPLAWQKGSICGQTDPEAFFPEKGGSTRDAKKICANCDVREKCLRYALDNDERFGIWGGLSERERRKLRKQDPKYAKQVA